MAVQLVVMNYFSPESPKYTYVMRNQFLQAYKDLQLLKGTDDVRLLNFDDGIFNKIFKVQAEVDLLDNEAKNARSQAKVGCLEMVRNDELRWSLFLALFLMFSVQFSGIGSGKHFILSLKI